MVADAQITVLHFVGGKYAGQEFALDDEAFIAGRSTEVDLVLADDAVSRKHARFYLRRGRYWVRDLGSRNGTLVNGEGVRHRCLRVGDRIAIGSSLARVESRAPGEVSTKRAGEQGRRRTGDGAGHSMTGTLEDIPLMDVLQWLATSRKTGALKVSDPSVNRQGALYLRDGRVFFAAIDNNESMHPEKALLRMLTWQQGTFVLEALNGEPPPTVINRSLEHLLMESARQQDEIAALATTARLPGPRETVRLVRPSPIRWSDLPPDELELVQDMVEAGGWWQLLDVSKKDDLSLYRLLVSLKGKGIVDYP